MPVIHSYDHFAPGDTVLAPMGPEDSVYCHWSEATFSFVVLRQEQGGVRWLEDGRDGPLFDAVESVYAPLPGQFMANLEHEGRERLAINGQLWPVPDSRVWLVNRDGVPLWTKDITPGEHYPGTTWIGMRQQEHPYYGQSQLGPDQRTFLYESATWPDYADYRFIWDGKVFFNGALRDLTHSPDWKLLSWIGSADGAQTETEWMYLCGKPMDTGYEYVESWSFQVCPEHRHYMYAVGSEDLDQGVSMVVDGAPQPGKYDHIQLWGNWFFDDPAHWFCCGIDPEDRHHVVKDGRILGVHSWADGFAELPGNRLAYLAKEGDRDSDSGWSARVDGEAVAHWPHVMPMSLAANGRGDVAYVVGLDKAEGGPGPGRMALVVNHEPVWTFDRPALPLHERDGVPEPVLDLSSDGVVRCLGIKDDALVMHTLVL